MSPVLQLLSQLVRINSVNPAYADGPGEAQIAAFIQQFFEEHEISVTSREVFPGRPNILARLPGRNRSRCLVLEAHTDTVSIKGMTIPPFDPCIRDGKLHGRGSCDTKAGLAAMMQAMISLKEEGVTPPCDVLLCAAVDEEYSYRGVVSLCQDLRADAAIVAEPTGLRCVIATKGVLRWRIRVQGRAAHSSRPQLGINAITHMARLIIALEDDTASLGHRPHPLLGPPTCNVGVIHGGVQVNFVPDECVIEIDRRLLPGETVAGVLAHYQGILDDLAARFPGFDAAMEEPMLTDEALETASDQPVVRTATAVLESLGLEPRPCGVPFGCDASKLSRAGVPSIVFGPGSIDRAHAAVEYVETAEVEQAVEFYRRFILAFEGDAPTLRNLAPSAMPPS
ncbi:MAG: acetylornithine deacetylase [Verrucomicrobia bacterium]|jgi:acetylornithine deacetylase|nr:MAG: acetylornithine deacetylase [Verrucomicrobiota bacterium]